MELLPRHIQRLEFLQARGFRLVAFPLYANCVGARKGDFAALLAPEPNGTFRLFGEPSHVFGENLSVRVREKGRWWFVFKQHRVDATAERLRLLEEFVSELRDALEAPV